MGLFTRWSTKWSVVASVVVGLGVVIYFLQYFPMWGWDYPRYLLFYPLMFIAYIVVDLLTRRSRPSEKTLEAFLGPRKR